MTSPTTARILTPFEQDAFARGLARWYRGRLIPIIRGAEETDEEKAAHEAREKAEREAAENKTFTQAELDRIVQERLARDRKDRPTDEEIAEMRKKAKEHDDAAAAGQTELEKAQKRAETAEQAAKTATETANKRLIEAAILSAAAEAKAIKPGHLSKLIDMNGVTVGDDGQVTGVEDAVKTFLEANPEYVGSGNGNGNGGAQGGGNGGGADQGARGGGKDQLTSTDGMSAEEIAAAVSEGRLDTYLSTPSK